MAFRIRTARRVARVLPLVAALLLGHPATGWADDADRQSALVQQSLMLSALIYDMRAHGFDAHFRYADQYQTRPEVEELRLYNQSLLLAKSSGRTEHFDGVAHFDRLPSSMRESTKKDLAQSEWNGICETSARFGAASFQLPISDPVNNREAFLLSATRLYVKGKQGAALFFANSFLDDDTAIERTSGDRDPVSCEDIWSLRNDTSLVTASNYKRAGRQCGGFHALAACVVKLEARVAELLPGAVAGGAAIDQSWRDEYLTDDGAFIPVLSP